MQLRRCENIKRPKGMFSVSTLGKLLCLIGHHHRSTSRARLGPDGWTSQCRHCGLKMKKDELGRWHAMGP